MNSVQTEDHPTSEAWWLPGAHLQTVWARIARSRRVVTFTREVLITDDDDDLVLDHLAGPPGTPRVLLLHGLEGSAFSLHTQGLAQLVAQAGWRGTVLNFRSCARDPARIRRRLRNRRPRLYHAGEIDDLGFVVGTLAAREPETPLYAIGFSLGGNVLLKWLGEVGAASAVRAAATISVPYDLAASAQFLGRGVGRFYGARFMNRLRAKAIDVLIRFPRETAHLDGQRIRSLQTLGEFDEQVTAPLHGFANAQAYYQSANTVAYLPGVAVPTLCISSTDDPFFPADALARARAAASADVMFEITDWGGHTGFVAGPWPWRPIYWAEERALAWLEAARLSAPARQ
jgi:hypothetical protein